MNHQQLPVLEAARTLEELLQTLLQRHTLGYHTIYPKMECVKGPVGSRCSVGGQNSPEIHNHIYSKMEPISTPHSPTINDSFTPSPIHPLTHPPVCPLTHLLGEAEGQPEQLLDEAQLLAAFVQEAQQCVHAEACGVLPEQGQRLHKAPGGGDTHLSIEELGALGRLRQGGSACWGPEPVD